MNLGDFTLGATFDVKFTTIDSTGLGSTLGSGAVAAYPGNSTTQLTAGITLSADFDALTGLNNVRVVASSGNGYAAATNYVLVLTAGTVDGVSVVGYVIAHFSLDNRSVAAVKTDTAAILVDTAEIGAAGAGLTEAGGTGDQLTALATAANLATVDTVVDSILVDTGTTLQAELDAIQAAVITNAAGVDIAADIIALKAVADAVLVDTGTTLDAALAVVDGNVDSILADTGTDGVVVAAASKTGYTLSAAGLADFFDTDSGTTYASAVDGSVVKEIAANAGGSSLTEAGIADAVWDELLAGHAGAGSAGLALTTASLVVGLDAAGVRTAVGLASANLDTQLAAIDTDTSAILVDTGTTLDDLITTVDTVVDAIKVQTDKLTFTVANQVDANTQYVNDTALTGDGGATPWGPA